MQKGGMSIYVLFLMFYFQNFSSSMFYYLILHGSYGVFWIAKDIIFPDQTFKAKTTFASMTVAYLVILGPYLIPAYRLCS